jgi:hypothetical protein
MMRAGEIQRVEAGANDVIAKLLHGGVSGADHAVRNPQIGPKPLNKRLAARVKQAFQACPFGHNASVHFAFDTRARVCFVCIPSGEGPG